MIMHLNLAWKNSLHLSTHCKKQNTRYLNLSPKAEPSFFDRKAECPNADLFSQISL